MAKDGAYNFDQIVHFFEQDDNLENLRKTIDPKDLQLFDNAVETGKGVVIVYDETFLHKVAFLNICYVLVRTLRRDGPVVTIENRLPPLMTSRESLPKQYAQYVCPRCKGEVFASHTFQPSCHVCSLLMNRQNAEGAIR